MTHYSNVDHLLIAADCIIFGFDGKQLQALLIKRAIEPEVGKWSLMGGFINKNESVDEAAARILTSLTGLDNVYMEQLHCFGDVNRDPVERVISISYFALINIADYSHQITLEHEARWFPLKEMPELIFDHKDMVAKAHERLKQKVVTHPIGFALLPPKFTLPQLQSLYEAIYEHQLDRRNFCRKILSLGIINKLDEKEKSSSRKGAYLYVFDSQKYQQLEKEGLTFM